MIFDHRRCELGEGPLWHPQRQQLFWFDITAGAMLSQDATGPRLWQFPEMVSAAGWVSADSLLIAGETGMILFDLPTETATPLCPLEDDIPTNRPNDGRADPQGGFWIGTMSKTEAPGCGAIYRYHRGELRRLYTGITCPNAICFTPDGQTAQFTDNAHGRVMRVALDTQGWPKSDPEVFLDLASQGRDPDGAVIAADGVLWIAECGSSRVAAYAPDGQFLRAIDFDAPHTSCPAFGGPDLTTLYCTSALQGMDNSTRARHPDAGKTFAAQNISRGQTEHRVTP